LVGIAAAPVAPVVFSPTARAVPGAGGRAISLVTVSGYMAFTVGPLLFGAVADVSYLRTSLLLSVTFGLGSRRWRGSCCRRPPRKGRKDPQKGQVDEQ